MDNTKISTELVKKIANLAKLPLDEKNIPKLQNQLEASFDYINRIQSLETTNLPETSQVTGLENIFRDDVIDRERILPQEDALSQSPATYKGFFKVKAIFDEE